MSEERARPQGKAVYESPVNPIAEEASAREREKEAQRAADRERRANRPVPDYICYPEAFKDYDPETCGWKDGKARKLPKCRVCEGILFPQENHKCSGYRPKYSDVPPEERMDMRRASWEESGDWDDDQYDETTPDPDFSKLRHEAETGETYDQVVIEGMNEDEYLRRKSGEVPYVDDMFRPEEPEFDPEFEGYEE
jgi:hypothetical protein